MECFVVLFLQLALTLIQKPKWRWCLKWKGWSVVMVWVVRWRDFLPLGISRYFPFFPGESNQTTSPFSYPFLLRFSFESVYNFICPRTELFYTTNFLLKVIWWEKSYYVHSSMRSIPPTFLFFSKRSRGRREKVISFLFS